MTNISNLDGLIAALLVFVCSCVMLRRVKAMQPLFMRQQFGPLSVLLKASVIGTRLATPIAFACFALALYILLQ